MAYCSLSDINALVPQQPFATDSVPSAEMVTLFLESIAQELDSVLQGIGYTVPVVSGASALNQLKWANAYGALGLAQDARSTAVYRDDSIGGMKNVWTQRYVEFKKALQDPKNPFELFDAPRTGTAVVKPLGQLQSSTVNNPDTRDYLDNPPFSIGMKL